MASSKIDWFEPAQGGKTFGVANLTNDPTVRDWANYHNTRCFSPDGRYVCFTRFASNGEVYGTSEAAEVHIFDLHTGEGRKVDNGISPRWGNDHNWLFYVRYVDGPLDGEGTEVWWLDVDADEKARIACGVMYLGETSFDDRWLFGYTTIRDQDPPRRAYRVAIREEAGREYIPGMDRHYQWIANPCHNVVFARTAPDRRDRPFEATRYWCDVDGKDIQVGSPFMEQCHQSWLGDGAYFLLGNSQMRGRRWDQPFPSSLHFLANVSTGDVSPCGRSGRYVCGDSRLADLRSGDGWTTFHPLSQICYPAAVKDNSGIYDADPKGSPDGTKVCFVSNYPLKDGPVAHITGYEERDGGRLLVESTEGFPASGHLVIRREVVRYRRRTDTGFVGLTRRCFDTREDPLRPGRTVTLFEARCLTDAQWRGVTRETPAMRKSIPDADSPLRRQRQTDVYVAVVRRPDRPCLRQMASDGDIQLVPGENHYETAGYYLLRDGERIAGDILKPGATLALERPGRYTAVSVEHSGLESPPSLSLDIPGPAAFHVLDESPQDFSWTSDRWLVDGREVGSAIAAGAEEAVREVVHLHDGVIHREWYRKGVLAQRHDLNAAGQAIRRLTYDAGRSVVREYYNREGQRVSREVFDAEGFITETIFYRMQGDEEIAFDRWQFDRGTPVRRTRGDQVYVKQGDLWLSVE